MKKTGHEDLVPSKRNSGVRETPSLMPSRDDAPGRFAVDEPNSQ